MNILTDFIKTEREYVDILRTAGEQAREKRPRPLLVTGLCEGARFAFYASVVSDIKRLYNTGTLLIVPDEKDSLKLSNAFIDSGMKPLIYPLRDFVFHNITASHEYEHERLSVLTAIINGDYDVIIATPDAALQFTMPRSSLVAATKRIRSDFKYEPGELVKFLEKSGYARLDMVDGGGQFSQRGGIIDIFPPQAEYPTRIDFFDDEIEQMGIFDILTQRRIEPTDTLDITPAREIIASSEDREELKKAIASQAKKVTDPKMREQLNSELESVDGELELNFADKYFTLFYPNPECLLDYFADSPIILIQERTAINERIQSFEWHMKQTVTSLLESGAVSPKYVGYNKWQADFDYFLYNRASIITEYFVSSGSGRELSGIFNFMTKQTVSYADNWDMLLEDLEAYIKSDCRTVLLCETETMAKNLRAMLDEKSIPTAVCATPDNASPEGTLPIVTWGSNIAGYEISPARYALLSSYMNQMPLARTPNRAQKKRTGRKKSAQEKILSYADLDVGDYIVHQKHGIGQYLGLESLTVDGIIKDYVKIKYGGTDMLYLPVNQLDMVSKYIGAKTDDGTVRLSRIGGGEWDKAKNRAKASAKSMAKELIMLYAERMRREGHAFAPDDEYQREFETAFEYEETEGQLNAVEDIKRDMERIAPMDRLLCGDVGFGKTEVALRAAFKAVSDNKQVALLVPTTILALQHYQTLSSRMRGFPIKIAMLSRFVIPKQQQEIVRQLRRGEVDIVVGTHRIVSNDVKFKDLGLIIVDEEQRFGVAHKEKLKQIAENVDALTLTATPIPRTLNMAMSGIRDMSILEEAPGDRFPVQTYVLEYDEIILAEAIKREIRRGGQIFYLHNRVEDIDAAAARAAKMAPDARIATAHGQMDKETLSDIWRSLVDGEVDMLISTTIIETGVDVPNANTLIIDDADRLGLSQLHQIRGRIGRSSRRAYAYLTYPKGKVLSEIAVKRLGAIRDYTEFGSGFKIALRDLEIRGAGNLLGSEQHGHIENVGYDLYMKILNEAILEEKGIKQTPKPECTIDLGYDAYLPEKFVRTTTQRIDAYKKIAAIENEEDYHDITDELLDRYGDIPKQGMNLLKISLIRGLSCSCRVVKVEQRGGSLMLFPEMPDPIAWMSLAAHYKGRLLVSVGSKPYLTLRIKKDESALDLLIEMLKKYKSFQEELKNGGEK